MCSVGIRSRSCLQAKLVVPADLSDAAWAGQEGIGGNIPIYFVAPRSGKIRNTIFYIHGAGWVFGSFHTHEKLVRELSAGTDSLIVFPEYSRSPEAKYPTAIEQCYFILSHIWEIVGDCYAVSKNTAPIVAGDSAGGNMAIAMVLMSAMRHGPCIQKLLLYYPVTNACFDTRSYCQFAVDYYLYREGMKWFWQQYTNSVKDAGRITASPLRAGIDCLKCFPPTMIINGQADVFTQWRGSLWRKASLCRRGSDSAAGTGDDSWLCYVTCVRSDKCLPHCYGCVNRVGEPLELKSGCRNAFMIRERGCLERTRGSGALSAAGIPCLFVIFLFSLEDNARICRYGSIIISG